MKRTFRQLLLTAATLICSAATTWAQTTPIQGQLPGAFTINADNDKIAFSQGNLQFNAAQGTHTTQDSAGVAGTWRFATNQYDICGSDNTQRNCNSRSRLIDVWLDLFYRATSGWHGYLPDIYIGKSATDGAPAVEMVGDKAWYDWGVYNAISNGGDEVGLWRTPTQAEWTYILGTRVNAANLRGFATVNGVTGYVLLPDNWSGTNFTPDPADFTVNVYDVDQWSAMETAGAVFLPDAGYALTQKAMNNTYYFQYRSSMGVMVQSTQSYVSMSTSSANPYYSVNTTTQNWSPYSVRLVHDLEPVKFGVTITQPEHGTITVNNEGIEFDENGSAQVKEGTVLQLTATPNEGYLLDEWTNYNPATGLTVSKDTAVTCSFKVQTFEVKFFDYDGTQIGETQIINYGGNAVAPADPEREGHTFTGWNNEYTNVKSNLNITATYEAHKYTVTLTAVHCLVGMYIQHGSTLWSSSTEQFADIPYGSMVYFWHDVDYYGDHENYMGYEFDHWEGYTPEYDSNNYLLYSMEITSDTVVKCVYREKTFQVTFVDWDGTELKAAQTVAFKASATPPANPTREGYTFLGWSPDYTEIRQNITAKAYYEKSPAEPVNLGDGTLTGAFSVNNSGKRIVFSQGNLRWRSIDNTWRFAEHQWETLGQANNYYYDGNPAWNDLFVWGSGNNPLRVDYEGFPPTLIAMPDFVDWGTNTIDNNGCPNATWYTLSKAEWDYIAEGRPNAINLRGLATVNGQTGLVLLPDNWVLPEGMTFVPDIKESIAPTNYALNIYSEEQWLTMENAGAVFLPAPSAYNTSDFSNNDVAPYILYFGKHYNTNLGNCNIVTTLSHLSYLGTHYAVRLVKDYVGHEVTITQPTEHGTIALVETDIDLSDVPEYSTLHFTYTAEDGYGLYSWSGGCEEDGSLLVTETTNVSAVFKQLFTVTFIDWDNTTLEEKDVVEGKTATITKEPEREGYTFTGWDIDLSAVTENLTATAQYEINKYSVVFVDWDNTAIDTQYIEWHSAATAPENPTREGWHFVGWQPADFTDIVAQMTVSAQYEINTYLQTIATTENGSITVKDTNNVAVEIDSPIAHGSVLILTATPSAGYHFVAWNDNVTDNPRTVTVKSAATYSASFAGHKADSVLFENIVSSTCTVAGSYDSVVYCSVCHVEISRDSISVPANGHKADSVAFENVVEATCTVAGSKDSVVYCSVCKAEVSRTKVVIPAHGHTVVVDSAVAATATTDGLTEGSHCSVCGETIVAQEVILATGEQGGNNQGGNENQGGENTEPATAVAESAAQAVNIYVTGNTIVVENATDEIFVYNVMGGLVARGTDITITVSHTGVYIVKTGNTAKRVMIY